MSADKSTDRLRQLKKEALQTGGPERVAARRKQGIGTARERVVRLLDADTFVELDVFVEGAVTGHGRIDGRDVYVFSQEGEGSPEDQDDDQAFVRKLVKVIELAVKNGAPIIGFYDCGRVRRDAHAGALGTFSGLYLRSAMASGLVPQIAAVMGPCSGTAAMTCALADVVIMVKGAGQLLLGDPMPAASEEDEVAFEELGGARTHSEKSGLAHLAADDETECLEMIRRALSYLPQNNLEEPPRFDLFDPLDRRDDVLGSIGALVAGHEYDMREVIVRVVDEADFFELSPWWARNLVVGLARLGGRAVGIVGNQPACLLGRIDIHAAVKAARFVRFCDAFNLPLVTFTDTPGFLAGREQEHGGLVRAGATLLHAYCEATVPKLTVVTHRAFAGGFEVMGSKGVGADLNFAWPAAEIGAEAPAGALDRQDSTSPYEAAVRGHLDDVIEPVETRPRLIMALEACASKREGRPAKKHGNIPL